MRLPSSLLADEFVRRHQRSLRGFLAYLGCPASQLDDLVQDVFLVVLSSDFEDRGYPTTASYLRKVARSLFLKALRREHRQPLVADWAAAEKAWTEFEREDGGQGYLEALRECLRSLGERSARAIDLQYAQRKRQSAIAERLGISESGVKSILVRARKRLRECVERRLLR